MGKTQIWTIKQSVYLGLLVLDLNETAMYEFWYNDVQPKYGENAKHFLWMQTASLFMKKQKMFIKISQNMLKQDLTIQILN